MSLQILIREYSPKTPCANDPGGSHQYLTIRRKMLGEADF
jgi:hypothetical protein